MGGGKEEYAGRGGYFQREDAKEWEEGDRGIERFYVYILEIDRPPGRYVGQTKNPRRRLRAHAHGLVKTTAGAAGRVVYVVEVGSREEAVRYEWFLKRMQEECPEEVGRLIRQGRKETWKVEWRSGMRKGARGWNADGTARWSGRGFETGQRVGGMGSRVGWIMVVVVCVFVGLRFIAGRFEEGRLVNETEGERVLMEGMGKTEDDGEAEELELEGGVVAGRVGERTEGADTSVGLAARAGASAERGGVQGGVRSGPPAQATKEGPARVGGEVREPARLVYVEPVYPEIAKRARVSGVVILEAIIDPNGSVTNISVLRSIPLLDQAAMDAVRQWKYRPTMLNGEPVPIVMTVTVIFE